MQALTNQVFIEEQYSGVTLGVIALAHGLIQVDAPPSPEDARSWRATLLNMNSGVERLLINLDGHPDRTLGARAMECTIVAQEKTADTFRSRPNTFKAQGEETGSDWESVVGLGSIRWAPPEISFSSNLSIEWSNTTVRLEHHSGPTAGSAWVILPEPKIVFVGDLVVKNQTPFLASSNLSDWQVSLDILGAKFKDYTIVSGRGGVVTLADVQSQRELISELHSQLDDLARNQVGVDALEKLIPALMAKITGTENHRQYNQRLVHGLKHYYTRHYRVSGTIDESEE